MAELTPKTINELPLASSLGANDLIPISSGGEAKRLPGSAIMQWNLIGSANGTAAVSIPSNATEIIVEAKYGSSALCFNFHLLRTQLTATAKTYTQGYELNSTSFGFCQVSATQAALNLQGLYISGTDYTASSSISVWAK